LTGTTAYTSICVHAGDNMNTCTLVGGDEMLFVTSGTIPEQSCNPFPCDVSFSYPWTMTWPMASLVHLVLNMVTTCTIVMM